MQILAHDLDELGDEAVKGAPACGCLSKDVGALNVVASGAFDGLDLAAQSLDALRSLPFCFAI